MSSSPPPATQPLWFSRVWRRWFSVGLASVLAPLIVAVSVVLGAGCGHTWRAKTYQPPLRLDDAYDGRRSLPGVILTRDMELPPSFWMPNSAYFVVVNKDRIRFHVTLVHKWEQIADPGKWRVYLEDAHGNRFIPEDVESSPPKAVTSTFEVNSRRRLSPYGLFSILVYRGRGDYVFHDRNIFSDSLRSLTLVMERPRFGYTYRYSWQFADDEEPGEGEGSLEVGIARAATHVEVVEKPRAPRPTVR